MKIFTDVVALTTVASVLPGRTRSMLGKAENLKRKCFGFLLICATLLSFIYPAIADAYTAPYVYVTDGTLSIAADHTITGNVIVENRHTAAVGDIVILGSLINEDASPDDTNIFAEQVLSDPFSLAVGESRTIPVNMSSIRTLPKGEYTLRVQMFLKNAGIPLGRKDFAISAGTEGSVFLLSDPTSLQMLVREETYTPGFGPQVAATDPKPIIKGVMQNQGSQTATFTPHWKLQNRTPFSSVLKEETGAPVSVEGSGEYSFEYPIPFLEAGSYLVTLWFTDAQGVQASDVIHYRYVGQGVSGKIVEATLDKTSYEAGENAVVGIEYSGSADRGSATGVRLLVTIEGDGGMCAEKEIVPQGTNTKLSESLPMGQTCLNPILTVKYYGGDKLLDEMRIEFHSKAGAGGATNTSSDIPLSPKMALLSIVGLIIVIGLVAYARKMTKNLIPPSTPLAVVIVLCGISLLGGLMAPSALAHVKSLGDDATFFSHSTSKDHTPSTIFITHSWSAVPGATNYRTVYYAENGVSNGQGHVDDTDLSSTYSLPRSGVAPYNSSFNMITQVIAENATKPVGFSRMLAWECNGASSSCNPVYSWSTGYEVSMSASNPIAGSTVTAGQAIAIDGDSSSLACGNSDAHVKIYAYFEQGGTSTYLGMYEHDIGATHGGVITSPFSISGASIPAGATTGTANIRMHVVYYYTDFYTNGVQSNPSLMGYPLLIADATAIIPLNVIAAPAVTVNLDADPSSIDEGESSTLTWSSTNATSCTASNGWSGSKSVTPGSHTQVVTPGSTTTYTITCTNGVTSTNDSVTVTVTPVPETPTVQLEIRKVATGSWGGSVTVDPGQDVELQWSSSDATRCVGDVHYSTGASSPADGIQQIVSEPSAGQRTYTVTCYNGSSGSDPSSSDTVTVTVSGGIPDISADPPLVDYGTPGRVIWDLNGHSGCYVTGANGDTVGSNLSTDGSGETEDLFGETVYTLVCTDTGASDTVAIRVRPRFEEI